VDVDVEDADVDREIAPPEMARLRRFNVLMAALHAAQAVAMVLLANEFALPVITTFLDGPPGSGVTPERVTEQFTIRLGPAVAAFLAISAIFHLLVASPLGYGAYRREIRAERNRFRWVEYSMSASLMIVLIAMLTGISDVAALIALFGVNAAMILFGWLMEVANPPRRPVWWTPFWFGCIAGAVPWIAISIYLLGPSEVPGFVYGIFVSLFVLFNCFAVNQVLQYRKVGPWRRYEFGERIYLWLSLVAKSALAWQVFANVLID
jgi:hypothetical protein